MDYLLILLCPSSNDQLSMIISYDMSMRFTRRTPPFRDDRVITDDVSSRLGVVLNDLYATLMSR
jgi:hypothetical protein